MPLVTRWRSTWDRNSRTTTTPPTTLLRHRPGRSSTISTPPPGRRRLVLVWTPIAIVLGIVGFYLISVLYVIGNQQQQQQQHEPPLPPRQSHRRQRRRQQASGIAASTTNNNNTTSWERRANLQYPTMRYDDYKQLAMELARLPPSETLRRLDEDDPFGVRSLFVHQNNSSSSAARSSSSSTWLRSLPCPIHQRISRPDRRNHTRSAQFRNNVPGTFLYFQHLRKAGGTHFCTLAETNLPLTNLPPYYCMPDYHWPPSSLLSKKSRSKQQHRCAGCLHHYTNTEIETNMPPYRIAGNEWDSFNVRDHFNLSGATYVTSFRTPTDRAVSQYRFECVEQRGCQAPTFDQYWHNRRDLYNVYTWTFSDVGPQARMVDNPQYASDRALAMGHAVDTVSRFHLVLTMEWLYAADQMIQSVLGFTNNISTTLQQKVRPHNDGYQRQDSFNAQTYLQNNATYQLLRQSLALDEILTDVARRLFLERLVCTDVDINNNDNNNNSDKKNSQRR